MTLTSEKTCEAMASGTASTTENNWQSKANKAKG